MKYKEFREYLKGTDFIVVENDVSIEVLPRVYKDGLGCVRIAKNTHRRVMLPSAVEKPEQFELIRKALELAETPLDEREEEIKYYIKFTKAEIEELKKRFDTDFNDFELIEVED